MANLFHAFKTRQLIGHLRTQSLYPLIACQRFFISGRSRTIPHDFAERDDPTFAPSESRSMRLGSIFKSADSRNEMEVIEKDLMQLMKGQPNRVQIDILKAYKRGMDSQSSSKRGNQDRSTNSQKIIRLVSYAAIIYMIYILITSPDRVMRSSFSKLLEPNIGNFAENVDARFSDVQGCDEVKKELRDIVDFLKYPHKYNKLGARLPKGVLLEGPPGVGKTLLARAVAGEANVPFIFISGSNFEEVFVGMGASRVRQLFDMAKNHSPCVIFIDEIDSVGRNRTSSPHHPYANQTINQLLAEMDGFDASEGIIVLGATNQKKDLDKALLRPGRFDLQIPVLPPNFEGRVNLFKLYLKKVKAAKEIDFEKLAHSTVGYTGADIENMVNQATITAGLNEEPFVNMGHLWSALDRIIMGPAKNKPIDEHSNRVAAFHEAGHALVTIYTKDSTPLHKVTIIPRGLSGGHTSFIPDKDFNYTTKAQLLDRLAVMMGGRAGEELAFNDGEVTTGASSDFQHATQVAKNMVLRFGLSDKLGPRVVGTLQSGEQISSETKQLIDSEVDKLLNEAMERARAILKEHQAQHKLLADALLHFETLSKEQVEDVISGKLKWNSPSKSNPFSNISSPFKKVKAQDFSSESRAKSPS